MTTEIHELSINELDTVSGGDMLGVAIDAAEKYSNGLFGRLIAAVHLPVTTQPTK
jgi:bacteriocin-like protein